MAWLLAYLVGLGLQGVLSLRSGGYTDYVCQGNRQVIVHLFEWQWNDIAAECEDYLGPAGYCGVQVSPPNEHIQGPAWWTRYQPVSYKMESRSGTREEFIDMVSRCKSVGVNIYVDGVINHMSGMDGSGSGTGGSQYDGGSQSYPGVPFSTNDFHKPICTISNYGDPTEVRNCYLVGLNDLDGAASYVQEQIAGYLEDCVNMGVVGFRIDAAKHMWPADIQGTIDRVPDLPEGGRPFFVHEVIDQGGEPIKVQEYFGVGRVTEFRYGLKMADLINGNNFGGLAGIYDQGWGMADPAHAMVFVDNHDNQRGHGGGGGLLTHDNPFGYKMGVAFMLAHDYGFKRVMSSYYFDNTDQGPPSTHPGKVGCGYPTWACEHRWSTIGLMVQFTNAVAGTGVTNWNAGSDWVAFGRGSKGFFAMGSVDGDFDTGLPDGDYCDIVSECLQTITISGGRGHFKPVDGQEAPAVAICVGCGALQPGTTSGPHPTAGTTTTKKPQPGTTATTKTPDDPATTTPAQPPGTTEAGWCCDALVLSSSGGIKENYPELLGKYENIGVEENDRGVWRHQTFLTTMHLHYTVDQHFKWEGWMVTPEHNETFGYISNRGGKPCPVGLTDGWDFQLPSGWEADPTFRVSCEGSTPPPGPSTTNGPTGPGTTTTRKPGPGGVSPTMVVIKQQTMPGADVFILGGLSPDTPIDITHYDWPGGKDGWDSVNDWNVGDTMLDWGPDPEPEQGEHPYDPNNPDLVAPAMGTPAAWTTNVVGKPAYYSLNVWGPHHWVVLVDMDCSQTQDGWFEFTTVYSLGGEDGEVAISQGDCLGEVGGTAPFTSDKHIARCGFLNVYEFDEDDCQIDEMPEVPPENDPCMPNCAPPSQSP